MTHSKNNINMFPKWDYIMFSIIYGYGWNIGSMILVILFANIFFKASSIAYLPFSQQINVDNILVLESVYAFLVISLFYVIYFLYKSNYSIAVKNTNNILYSENPKIKQQNRSYIAPIRVFLLGFNIHVVFFLLFILNKLFPAVSLSFISSIYSHRVTSFMDSALFLFVFIQLVQVGLLVMFLYTKSSSTFSRKYLQILGEQIVLLKGVAYSRFWLYSITLSLLAIWIFIHPITLIIAKLFS